jgi:hypothetical protein
MKCDKCGGDTQQKRITSKKNGNKYTVYECTSGCMDGRYKYSFFPPKDAATPTAPKQQQSSGSSAQVVSLLEENNKLLAQILTALTGKIAISKTELKPDDEFVL